MADHVTLMNWLKISKKYLYKTNPLQVAYTDLTYSNLMLYQSKSCLDLKNEWLSLCNYILDFIEWVNGQPSKNHYSKTWFSTSSMTERQSLQTVFQFQDSMRWWYSDLQYISNRFPVSWICSAKDLPQRKQLSSPNSAFLKIAFSIFCQPHGLPSVI